MDKRLDYRGDRTPRPFLSGAFAVLLLAGLYGCPEKELAPEQYVGRGVKLVELDRLDEALEDFDKAIALRPEWNEPYMHRASIRFGRALYTRQAADYDKAIADYSRAIKLLPYSPAAFYFRGQVYYSKGEISKALPDFRKACEMRNESGCLWAKRAQAKLAGVASPPSSKPAVPAAAKSAN